MMAQFQTFKLAEICHSKIESHFPRHFTQSRPLGISRAGDGLGSDCLSVAQTQETTPSFPRRWMDRSEPPRLAGSAETLEPISGMMHTAPA
jgi:hypothetical protein